MIDFTKQVMQEICCNPEMKMYKKDSLKNRTTSWESSGQWYQSIVGKEGHYYHKEIIIPGLLKLMEMKKNSPLSILDLACGNAVLARHLPKELMYVGIDIAPSLIRAASKEDRNSNHQYLVGDVSKSLPLDQLDFDCATVVLAIQNIKEPEKVFLNAYKHLSDHGHLLLVINHPCFRIPRQSSWQVDEEKKWQYRRVDRYMSSMEIPIQTHPSKAEKSQETWSFHHPLSAYSHWLHRSGFCIEVIEEWVSNKVSTGKAAKMENQARKEIPLFMAIKAVKRK